MTGASTSPAERRAALPPQIAGHHYEKQLGEGGYSVVLLYRDEHMGRHVAVKVLQLLDEGARRQFATEVRLVQSFNGNPLIVPIYSQGQAEDGRPYFTMPYCPGDNLSTRVRSVGQLPVSEVIDTGLRIGRALDLVHGRQWLHRDVKPSNILLDAGGVRPRLSDFGIAAPVRPSTQAERSDLAASVAWSAPEVVAAGDYGSIRSDVYSLGATLWHLLVGHSPYEIPGGDNTVEALERRIAAAHPPGLRRDGVPAGLEHLLRSMIDKDPQHRPENVASVVRVLETLEAQSRVRPRTDKRAKDEKNAPVEAADSTDPTTNGTRSEPRSEPEPALATTATGAAPGIAAKHRILIAAGLIVVVTGVLAGVGLLSHHTSPAAAPAASSGPAGLGAPLAGQDPELPGDDVPPGVPDVTATRLGPASLQFGWTYAAAQADDTFEWRAADGPQSGVSSAPTITLADPAGKQLCVQVRVVRADGGDADVSWSPAGCGS